jgi:hypothetical protein
MCQASCGGENVSFSLQWGQHPEMLRALLEITQQ